MTRIAALIALFAVAVSASADDVARPALKAARQLQVQPMALYDAQQKGFAALDPQQAASVAGWLRKKRAAFALLREARGIGSLTLKRRYDRGFEMEVRDLLPLKRAARAACVRAEMLHSARRDAEARASLADAVWISEVWRSDGVLISQLVRIVCLEMVLRSMQRCMRSEPQRWVALLPEGRRLDKVFCEALLFEADCLEGLDAEGRQLEETFGRRFSWAERMRVPADARRLAGLFRRAALAAEKPYHEVRAELAAIEREATKGPRWRYPVAPLVMRLAERAVEKRARVKARLALIKELARCRQQRARSGSFPRQARGTDPFSGKPLRVDHQQKLLYSVGPDGRDDGGRGDDLALELTR